MFQSYCKCKFENHLESMLQNWHENQKLSTVIINKRLPQCRCVSVFNFHWNYIYHTENLYAVMLWRRKYDTFKEYLLSVLSVRWMSIENKIFRYLSTVWTNTLFNYYIIDRLSLTKPLWHMVLYPGVRAIYSWEDENNFTGWVSYLKFTKIIGFDMQNDLAKRK